MTKLDAASLNPKQIKAVEMLANPEFEGTITKLCSEVGVSRTTFYEWMGKAEFRAYLNRLIDRYTDGELSKVWHALLRNIEKGDTQAIKLYFELKGRYRQEINTNVRAENPFAGLTTEELKKLAERGS